MGIIPFQYLHDETSETLGLSGRETITVDLPQNLQPGQIVTAQVCNIRDPQTVRKGDNYCRLAPELTARTDCNSTGM